MKSIFEEMGGTYRQEGDYLIPNLELLPIPDYKIGKYGRMHRNYLKEHRKVLYTNLILDGTLFERLAEIDQACNERMELICTAMAKQEGVTEALKLSIRWNGYAVKIASIIVPKKSCCLNLYMFNGKCPLSACNG